MIRGLSPFVLLASCTVAACGGHASTRPAPPPRLPETKTRQPKAPPPPEWFWEPVEADVRPPSRKPLDLPIPASAVVRADGAAQVWDGLKPDVRDRIRRDGVVVAGDAEPQDPKRFRTMGAFYMDLQSRRVPAAITLDALFTAAHVGLERALAEIEEEMGPLLAFFVDQLDERLRAEAAKVGTELADGYRLARGLVGVARALARPSPPPPPPDLAIVIAQERGNIEGSAGVATSPLLGVPIDYARFVLPRTTTRPGPYRALAWLAAAPLGLAGRTEAAGSQLDVGQARVAARAAMVLARVCTRDVDAGLHAAYTRLLRWLAFVYGPPDDLTLVELDELATSAGVDLTKPANIASVVRVDKLRARARAGRAPAIYDGSGGLGRGGVGVRLFGGHAAADSLALQSLVGVPVGLAQEGAASDPVLRSRQARRVLPSTLDVAAWLGAPAARAVIHESHADAYDGYNAALVALQRMRPTEPTSALHASVHGSLIDALLGWSATPPGPSTANTVPIDRARLESILAGWTLVRHLGQALARPRPSPTTADMTAKAEVSSDSGVLVFVEPMPEAIARLAGAVRQARRGLEALVPPAAGTRSPLADVEEILHAALRGAERHASDEAPTSEEAAALAALPARLARLEEPAVGLGPVVSIVFSDAPARRVVATATGKIEPVYLLYREASSDVATLAIGAHLGHHELVEGVEDAPGVVHAIRPSLTDEVWRQRVAANLTKRADWVASFRSTR